jgi:hypothetical protein
MSVAAGAEKSVEHQVDEPGRPPVKQSAQSY